MYIADVKPSIFRFRNITCCMSQHRLFHNFHAFTSVQGDCHGLCETAEIPTGYVSPECITTYGLFSLYLANHKCGASQMEIMFYVPLTVLLPPGWDCVAVSQEQVYAPSVNRS